MATEIEMKLRVPDEATLERVLTDEELMQYVKDDMTTRKMVSAYYDTEDGALEQRHWTLRMRNEGGVSVAAFKTANASSDTGFFTRSEWQCLVDNVEDAIPMLIDQGAPRELKSLLKGKHLHQTCGAEFIRKSVVLFLNEGARIEMAGDLGYLYAGSNREPICELELELLYGDVGSLPPLCSQLVTDYGLIEEPVSKYQRARALAK